MEITAVILTDYCIAWLPLCQNLINMYEDVNPKLYLSKYNMKEKSIKQNLL